MEAILKVSRVMRNKPVILSTRLCLQAVKKVFDKTEFSTLTDFQLGSTLCLTLRCSEFHFGFPFDPPKTTKESQVQHHQWKKGEKQTYQIIAFNTIVTPKQSKARLHQFGNVLLGQTVSQSTKFFQLRKMVNRIQNLIQGTYQNGIDRAWISICYRNKCGLEKLWPRLHWH